MFNYLKKRRAIKTKREIEEVARLLLSTPNLSFMSQVQIVDGARELLKQKLESL